MGKNKVKNLKKPSKFSNPIYKKVTSKTQTKAKSKTKPIKTSVAKTKLNNRKAREELDCKWKEVRASQIVKGQKAGPNAKPGTSAGGNASGTKTPPAK